jgi:hypothetical protein
MRINLFLDYLKKKEKSFEPKQGSEFLTTKLNQVRMKALHQWLTEKNFIDVDVDSWLYWFNLQTWINKKKQPIKIKWIGTAYHLPNVVFLICGNMNKQTETAMQKSFILPKGSNFQKMTITAKDKKRSIEPYKSIYNIMEMADRNIKDLQ